MIHLFVAPKREESKYMQGSFVIAGAAGQFPSRERQEKSTEAPSRLAAWPSLIREYH